MFSSLGPLFFVRSGIQDVAGTQVSTSSAAMRTAIVSSSSVGTEDQCRNIPRFAGAPGFWRENTLPVIAVSPLGRTMTLTVRSAPFDCQIRELTALPCP